MNQLDLKNPAVQKILLSVVLAAGVLGVFFFTHLLPITYPNQQARIQALKVDYEKKSTDLARARATVADLPRFEAEYEQLHQRWQLAAELLPADRQLPALLRRITLAGQQSGVEFVLFKPTAAKAEEHYTELPMQITVSGGYHQVGSFLAELSNMRRIVTVSGVRVKAAAEAKDFKTTSVEFNASAYSLNSGAPAASASTGAKGKNEKGESDARKSS